MTTQANPQSASAGARGFDLDSPLTPGQAACMKGKGYAFCLRYVSLMAPEQHDLHAQEVQDILAAGLALMPVQHVMASGWDACGSLGIEHGKNAAANAGAAGIPAGVNLWLDLEGVAGSCVSTDVLAYCGDWYGAVKDAGYLPGIYVGAACIVDDLQLYDLPFQHYWKSLSHTPAVAHRGYQMVQTACDPADPLLDYDIDVIDADALGGLPVWLIATPA